MMRASIIIKEKWHAWIEVDSGKQSHSEAEEGKGTKEVEGGKKGRWNQEEAAIDVDMCRGGKMQMEVERKR
jgi:hypothetical protein